uniref:Uncharacterized protein n=1 Tax=Avena sativa TaxID=4498 RepID=A0ACD6A4B9_AVESA
MLSCSSRMQVLLDRLSLPSIRSSLFLVLCLEGISAHWTAVRQHDFAPNPRKFLILSRRSRTLAKSNSLFPLFPRSADGLRHPVVPTTISSDGSSGKPVMMVSSEGEGGGGLENPATAVCCGGGSGLGMPATVAGSGGGVDSENPATVARSRVGDSLVKPATVASGSDCSVKPATTVTGGGNSSKSVMAASSGGSSRRAMLHGIEIPEGMDPAISFLLTIRMDTYQVALDGSMRRCSEFDYPLIVESSMNFNEVQQAMCNKYPWGINDLVLIRYFDRDTNCYVDVKRDDDLALMFGKYQGTRSVVVQLFAYFKTLLRTVIDCDTVHVIPQTPTPVNVSDRQPPSPAGASQRNRRKVSSSNANDILNADCDGVLSDGVHSEDEDSEDEDSEDEDEKMYPDLARFDHNYIPAIYASTDDEEDQEDIDMGGFIDEEIEADVDRPIVEYDKNNPSMEEGTVFPSVIDCRNALATFAIVKEFDYITEKSDPTRLRAHCAFEGCRWRIHASFMKNSKLFQIKVNPYKHICPTALESEKLLAAKSRWVCDVVLEWVRKNPAIGVSTLIEKIQDKYKITVPYMRVSNGREKALDKLLGKWAESFHLLYTFKAEVERCSPGSVVDIDRHTVQYKVKGVTKEKECFRRVFVSFKACWQGFKDGRRPYLAVDATALNGRFKGQLVAACAVDAHNWLSPVAYGVLETESTESWTWWLERLHQVVGHPEGLVIHTDACKGLETAVESVFPGVEHRECMRHLATNFSKKFRGKIFDDNLWPASLTCNPRKHAYHLRQMYSKPKVQEYLEACHTKLWARSKFNEVCKVDYVNNNLAESFNSKLKKVKALQMVDMFDCLRQRSIFKFNLRRRIA